MSPLFSKTVQLVTETFLQRPDQSDRAGLRLGRVGGEKYAVRPGQRRASLASVASRRAPFETRKRMMSSEPRLAAPWMARRPMAFAAFTSLPDSTRASRLRAAPPGLRRRSARRPVHAGRGHQRRGAGERGDVRVGAVLEQQAHHRDVAGQRGAQERRLAGEVHPRQRAEPRDPAPLRRDFLRPRVRVGALRSSRRMSSSIAARSTPLSRVGPRYVEVADIHGGQQRRLAVPVRGVDVRAALDEQPRDSTLTLRIAISSGVTPSASALSSVRRLRGARSPPRDGLRARHTAVASSRRASGRARRAPASRPARCRRPSIRCLHRQAEGRGLAGSRLRVHVGLALR